LQLAAVQHGKSFAYLFEPEAADSPAKRTQQYYEM